MSEPYGKAAHDAIRNMLDAVEANGWITIEVRTELPGQITLESPDGHTRIMVEDKFGLNMMYYLEQLKARPLPDPMPFGMATSRSSATEELPITVKPS